MQASESGEHKKESSDTGKMRVSSLANERAELKELKSSQNFYIRNLIETTLPP